jgi:hypothetical protein
MMNILNFQRRIWTIVSVTIGLAAFAANAAAGAADFADELRGLSFGTPLTSIQNLVRFDPPHSGLQFFTRRGDDLHYRGVPLNNNGGILYGFREGKLEVVELWKTGMCSDTTLRRAVQDRFGKEKYYALDNNEAWRQKEAECKLYEPSECNIYKFEGFPNDANAKGIIAWNTRYIDPFGLQRKKLTVCTDRVRFSQSPRTRAERDKAKKDYDDLLEELFPTKKK